MQGGLARVAGRGGRLDELCGRVGDGREPRALDRRLGHEHDVAAVLHPLVRLAGRCSQTWGDAPTRAPVGLTARARAGVRGSVAPVRVRGGRTAGARISLRSTRSPVSPLCLLISPYISLHLTAGVCISLRSTRSKLPHSTERLHSQPRGEWAAAEAARSSARGSGCAPRAPAMRASLEGHLRTPSSFHRRRDSASALINSSSSSPSGWLPHSTALRMT